MSTPQIARMLAFIENCADAKKLRQLAANAEKQGVPELAKAARLKLYSILPSDDPKSLEFAVWQSIFALEDVLKQERGKTIMLSRTRQKIGRQGVASCVADLVTGKASEGFQMLLDRDMLQLSFEAIALSFPDRFEEPVLQAASKRLQDVGYSCG